MPVIAFLFVIRFCLAKGLISRSLFISEKTVNAPSEEESEIRHPRVTGVFYWDRMGLGIPKPTLRDLATPLTGAEDYLVLIRVFVKSDRWRPKVLGSV